MSDLSDAACKGKWWIFDSVDLFDHAEAAEICARCPVIEACEELLEEQRRTTLAAAGGGPSGTWAGRLVGTAYKPLEHGTDRGYHQHRNRREAACEPCRTAHRVAYHDAKAVDKRLVHNQTAEDSDRDKTTRKVS